ncbi:MAG: carbohydrate ABC transporter permease, partial [Lachnospiraceae bacterium]|nr:carbohydrate ABC transporter permease [Lachnospiraceae bacterium]
MTKKNHSAIQRRLIPSYIFLIIVSFISVFPFYWMISAATNTTVEVATGKITIGIHALENFTHLLQAQDLWRTMGNSFLYSIVQTILCLVICSLAGYGFELYHDSGKDKLFAILLLAMMIPGVA